MFNHITVGSNDLDRAGRFYDALLFPLGLKRRLVEPDGGPRALCWVGDARLPRFYVYEPFNGQPAHSGNGTMVAFRAQTEAQVIAAYEGGMANGGTDEGAPGLRPHYAADYFGAYLRDPDGNKIHIVRPSSL